MALEEKEEREEENEKQEVIDVIVVPIENTSESETESESENEENQNKNQSIRTRHYGNFREYYERRNEGLPEVDRRLGLLRKEWFEDKECLDIGCNNGIFTISIAKIFRCRSILAIDIDPDLVEKANSNLRKAATSKPPGNTSGGESSKVMDKVHADDSEQSVADSSNEEIPMELSSLEERNLLDIVTFKQENFVESQHPELYDTVLCLSVTQWIHLNWGDHGLITLFYKIWEVLRPGGVLVLEPQPWRSYINKHELAAVTAKNFYEIELRPKDFQEILLDKIGFRTVEHINSSWLGNKIRFNRPVLVFKK